MVYFSANKVGGFSYDTSDENFIKTVREKFNKSLTFDPSEPLMGFSVRDPLINGRYRFNASFFVFTLETHLILNFLLTG